MSILRRPAPPSATPQSIEPLQAGRALPWDERVGRRIFPR